MVDTERFEKVEITTADELRAWLHKNHMQKDSVWVVTYKKKITDKYVSTSQVLDELLSFGWIDGMRRKLNDERTMQLISPRKAEHWTRTYKERAARLIEEGRMQQSGHNAIEQSKRSGLWNFMDDVDNLVIPDDLKSALGKSPRALEFFENINPSSKRFVLRWIKLAKTEGTRARRIRKIADLSAKGEKLPGS
jgi:uncharacterized protein YdeI (YjbR/CyaY-like superfamily)